MKRLLGTIILILCLSFPSWASHITGGEMYYTFIGITSDGRYQYNVTLKLFQRCGSGRQFPSPNIVSIFDRGSNTRVTDITVPLSNQENISMIDNNPCITNPPVVCYDVAYYNFVIALPKTEFGYLLASQVNYRIAGINNLESGYNNVGATYTAEIPGFAADVTGPENHSAHFTGSDLVVVCANNDFSYSFAAQDPDGDELRYYFCEAYASTNANGGSTVPTNPPPFPSVPYQSPFYDGAPLGPMVSIDQFTGLITGTAPPSGMYVVTVCVEEIRGGRTLSRQRKDLQINITDCSIASASLLPDYSVCKNSLSISLVNQSESPLIVTTDWDFYDNANTLLYSYSGPVVDYTFPAVGDYKVKLTINRGQQCNDSTFANIHVWPGFVPNFDVNGICFNKPSFFNDRTTSVYGVPNTWNWDFGELSASNDFSFAQNAQYTYPGMGNKRVRLIVTDTKGCRDTITKLINIIDKPPVNLAFRDTLICVGDRLMLKAIGSGTYSWSPPVNIINANTATPTVFPVSTMYYYVDLDDNGCKNRDSVRVRVVDHVTVSVMPDTIICRGDTIQLRIQSDGLQFQWSPAGQIIDPNVMNPFVFTPNAATDYQVKAIIGGCSATKNIRVSTVPYPVVNAGIDTSICYNTPAFLHGTTDGSSWTWSPPNALDNANSLNPVSHTPRTTAYVLSAFDTKGCPKAGRDTVIVTVYPRMHISAGADTMVIVGQPLQLNATGGESYFWSPTTGLSSTNIANPVAVFTTPFEVVRYKVIGFSENGCADSAYVSIRVFKSGPTVFVPTAFTPNNDGRNDLLRPIAVGMRSIENFSVYNRWGQLIFHTRINGQGWDGRVAGQLQDTGTFVWMVKATDYTGKSYFQKGTFTLIR